MATTTDPETTLVSESDHRDHKASSTTITAVPDPQVVNKSIEEETHIQVLSSPTISEDAEEAEAEISVKKPAGNRDDVPLVAEVKDVDPASGLEIPVEAVPIPKEVPPVPEPETVTALDSRSIVVEEQLKEKPEIVAAEDVQEKMPVSDVADSELENKIAPETIESIPDDDKLTSSEAVHKKTENLEVEGVEEESIENWVSEAIEVGLEVNTDVESTQREVEVVEAEVKEKPALEVGDTEPKVKTQLQVVGDEMNDSEVLEVVQNEPKEKIEIESTEKQVEENRVIDAIDPIPSTEQVQNVEDLPREDSKTQTKKELEEIPEPQPQEVEKPSTVNEVLDGPLEESQESKVIAEEVEEKSRKDVEEEMTIDQGGKADENKNKMSTSQESDVVETYEAVPSNEEARADTVNSDAEKTLAEKMDTAARGLYVVDVMSKEDGNAGEGDQQKDVKFEEEIADENAKHEELVPNETENRVHVVDGQLKDERLAEEDKQEKDVKVDEVLEEKISNPKEMVQSETAHVEDTSGSIVGKEVSDKSFAGEQISRDLEVVKEEEKEAEEENTGALEPGGESKDSQLETKVEETTKDLANESESKKETADEGKPDDPPTLEPSRNVVDETIASRDLPTTEVIIKSTHKSSGNIISKVKQSIVKVKKAITGKSPSSKAASAEPKVEVKAK